MDNQMKKEKTMFFKDNRLISACFGFCCALLVTGIALCFHRKFDELESFWTFSIGADIFCMAICTMLCFSCLLTRKENMSHTKFFVSVLTSNASALFFDECSWIVQGVPAYRLLNLVINVLFFMNGAILIYMFWVYVTKVLNMKSKLMRIADKSLMILLIPTLALSAVNFFYPLYFSVDENGVYQREHFWVVSQFYLVIGLIVVVAGLCLSKASVKDRLITASFVAIPLVNLLLTRYTFGITTQYASMTVSIVLIYGVLFAEREQSVASTEKELTLATRIQSDMLPGSFPFMPERREFDIYAIMDPAKDVGGDFYDFFMIDENRLGMVIADVSGKGIPAALFMMAAKILIKNCAMTGLSPGKVLESVNKQIYANNREEMFVTVWFGVLDLTNGKVTAANAGHEFPMIKRNSGGFELFKDKHSMVIGALPGIKYKEYELDLAPGEKIFLYTDGAAEAENIKLEQFGCDRLLTALNEAPESSPEVLVNNVRNAVEYFVDSAAQFDDLTLLCVEYSGMTVKSLTLDAVVDNIDQVVDFVNEELEAMDCPVKAQTQIDIAIDELFGNIARYSYSPEIGTATVRLEVKDSPLSVEITFIDKGKPFNPLDQADPDTTLSAEDRKEGGLGIFLVKKTMNLVDYEYKDGRNILKIVKNLE